MDDELYRELSDLNAAVADLRANVKAAFHRIDEQKALADSVHTLALTMERMLHEQGQLRQEVDAMKGKQAKRWETAVTEGIKLVVAAGVGALLLRLGLSG